MTCLGQRLVLEKIAGSPGQKCVVENDRLNRPTRLPARCIARSFAVGQTIRAQATIMGYADSFALIGVVLLVAVLTVTMLRKGAAAGGAAH